MTEPLRRADDRCRHCGRQGVDAHRQDCPLAPVEPLPDDPAIDEGRTDAAEDEYQNAMIGEYGHA